MRRILTMSLVVLLNFIFQTTFLGYVEVFNIKPNTALLIVISYAIIRGDIEGSILGFFAGLLQDMFFGKYIGFSALAYFLTGYFCGKPFKDFYLENRFLPIFLTAVFSLLNDFMFYFFNYFFRAKLDIEVYLTKIIIPSAVYNVILVAVIYYKLIYHVDKLIVEKESGWFSFFK